MSSARKREVVADVRPFRSRCDVRRGFATVVALFALAVALVAPRVAQAAVYVHTALNATAFVHHSMTLAAGSHTIKTANLTAGADPYLHVVRDSTNTEPANGHNDDFAGAGLNSQVTINVPSQGSYTIIVRKAKFTAPDGRGDVIVDNVTVLSQVLFGGYTLPVQVAGTITYENALINQGATDTYMLGLDANMAVVAKDDDSGVWRASRFVSDKTTKVVIGAYSETTGGPTTVYVNKTSADADLDGLGDGIEMELGTCGQPTCYTFPPTPTSGKDSDKDGLFDYIEVFGVESQTGPALLLPQWGGSPLHKDVFVELDYSNEFSTNPFTVDDATFPWLRLQSGHPDDVLNPDRTSGIAIHMDIGQPLRNPGDTWYGNYGGTNKVNTTDSGVAYNDPTAFDPTRKGIFHYGLMYRGVGGYAGSRMSFHWGGNEGNRNMQGGFLHELGHNLGLEHWGHVFWGAANCKPTYRSVMNYAFEFDGVSGFSKGQLWDYVVNPAKAMEGGLFSSSADISFLSGKGTYFDISINPHFVDWNRDGRMDNAFKVRAPATWAPGAGCAALIAGAQDIDALTSAVRPDPPKLVKAFGHMYVFYVDWNGVIKYRHGAIAGADAAGSCQSEANCVTWSAPLSLSGMGVASGVSVTRWKNGILLAYRRETDGKAYARYSTTVNGVGDITNWSGDFFVDNTEVTPEASSVFINYNGTLTDVAFVFTSVGGYYRAAHSPQMGTGFGGQVPVTTANSAVLGSFSPTVIRWPSRGGIDHSSIETLCGVFPDLGSAARLYCLDKTSMLMTDVTARVYTTDQVPTTSAKAGLAFHIPRREDGAPIVADTAFGQLYMVLGDGARKPIMYMSKGSSSPIPSGALTFVRSGEVWDDWQKLPANSGFTIYEDESLSAPKAAAFWDISTPQDPYRRRFMFVGLADGSFNASLKDGNDFQVMERGICLGPQFGSTTHCGAVNNFGY